MKILVNQLNKEEPFEILITSKENDQISQALLSGAEFLRIGDQTINVKYIIGIFEGAGPPIEVNRRIEAPKEKADDPKKTAELMADIRRELEEKGILTKKEKVVEL